MPGFNYGTLYGAENKHGIIADTPCPGSIAIGNSRQTVAVDMAFDNAYMAQNFHCGVLSRFGDGSFWAGPDNRSAAVIAGEYYGKGMVGIEEIRVGPAPGYDNVHHNTAHGVLQPNRSYRFIVDTIRLNGQVGIEGRCIDNATGQGVWSTGTIWSAYPGSYFSGRQNCGLFNIIAAGAAGTIYFTNMKCYWSNATEWVANP